MHIPEEGTLWKHHKQPHIYKVLMITNMFSTNENYPLTIVYENAGTGSVWSRPLDKSWYEKYKQIEEE